MPFSTKEYYQRAKKQLEYYHKNKEIVKQKYFIKKYCIKKILDTEMGGFRLEKGTFILYFD